MGINNNEGNKNLIDSNTTKQEDKFNKDYFEIGTYSSYKQGYDTYIEQLNYSDMVTEIITSLKPKRVLDVGCAMGRVVGMFLDNGVDAVGVDISEYAISQADEKIKERLKIVNLETDPIPFRAGEFDFISCLAVIEHLKNDTNLISEISRLIKPSGTVYLTTPPKKYKPSYHDKTHINLHEYEYWIQRFREFGFDVKPLKIHDMFGNSYMRSFGGTIAKVKTQKPTGNLGRKLPYGLWVFTVSILKYIQNSRLYKRNRFIWAYILTIRGK